MSEQIAGDWFAVTPGRGDEAELKEKVPALVRGGVTRILLREKQLSPSRRSALAEAVLEACSSLPLRLWISGDSATARRLGLAGVHLAESDSLPSHDPLPFGVSLHRDSERWNEQLGAVHHGFLGPVFATPSKPSTTRWLGTKTFLELASRLRVPVYAIGGVNQGTIPQLAKVGIRHAAAIRLFFDSNDPEATARQCRQALEEC